MISIQNCSYSKCDFKLSFPYDTIDITPFKHNTLIVRKMMHILCVTINLNLFSLTGSSMHFEFV